jgi:DNA polymerase elongation subunit (family B)
MLYGRKVEEISSLKQNLKLGQENSMTDKLRVAALDTETSFNIGFFWRPGYNLTIGPEAILEERQMLCVCWEFLDSNKRFELKWDGESDYELIKELGRVLREDIDVVVAHNGDRFDLKWIKARTLYHRLPPITNVTSIDTLKLCRSNFNLNSNKLDYVAKFLNVGGKMATGGIQLWKDVFIHKSDKALDKMVRYCHRDVRILKKAFKEILPYCDKLPIHMGIAKGGDRDDCPMCGSSHVHKHSKIPGKVGMHQKYRCQKAGCGHVWKDNRKIKEIK